MRRMKGSEYHVRRVKKAMKAQPEVWARRFRKIEERASARAWREGRAFWDYRVLLESVLPNRSIIGTLVGMRKRRPLRILEDGAGKGIAAAELKSELAKKGIKSEVIGLSLTKEAELLERESRGEIDRVVVGKAELFVPKKPFDLILSVTGSTTHTLPSARKDHLLKFAHSLSRGGVMLVCFQLDLRKFKDHGDFLQEDMQGVVRAFDKRGFDAKFEFKSIDLSLNQIMSDPDLRNYFHLILYVKKRGGRVQSTPEPTSKPPKGRLLGWFSRLRSPFKRK